MTTIAVTAMSTITATTITETTTTMAAPCVCNAGCDIITHTHCFGCGAYGYGLHLGTAHGCNISVSYGTKICYYNGNINYSTYCSLGLCTLGSTYSDNALCL